MSLHALVAQAPISAQPFASSDVASTVTFVETVASAASTGLSVAELLWATQGTLPQSALDALSDAAIVGALTTLSTQLPTATTPDAQADLVRTALWNLLGISDAYDGTVLQLMHSPVPDATSVLDYFTHLLNFGTGGDINDAYRVTLTDGRDVFVKANDRADSARFPTEARGLKWLAEAGALRIPDVLAVSNAGAANPFLVLEYLAPAPRVRDFDERLGRGLALLHRTSAPAFGLDFDNFIGRLPQSNRPRATWAEFYRDERLLPQIELARKARRATARMERGFESLLPELGRLVGPEEPPARVHGDLWGGNLHVDEHGEPCLIDPAPYGGHREVDLAMMRLFGGFSMRTFEAYAAAYPLAPGHEERVELYQLYFLMVHVNLFGGSYGASVESALARYA